MSSSEHDAFGVPIRTGPSQDDDPLGPETISKPGRDEIRQKAIDDALRQARPAPSNRRPILWLMGGGSASGKSTVLTELQNAGDIPASGAVKIDADAFKLAIPEFHELRDRNDHRAGTFVHAESSLIASRTFEHAIAMRSDVIYDTTLSDYSKVVNLMNQARNGDYEIRIVGVTATPLTAISRMVERGKTTGRYVPIKALLTTHKNFARSFEKYVGLADAVELWKTDCADSKSAELIAVKQDDHLDILRPGDYAEFEKSRQLNENANTPDEI